MKFALIMLFAIAAVAMGASVEYSGADFDGAGATAGGRGNNVAADSRVVETKDLTGSEGRASATRGEVKTSSVIFSGKVRKSAVNARAQRV